MLKRSQLSLICPWNHKNNSYYDVSYKLSIYVFPSHNIVTKYTGDITIIFSHYLWIQRHQLVQKRLKHRSSWCDQLLIITKKKYLVSMASENSTAKNNLIMPYAVWKYLQIFRRRGFSWATGQDTENLLRLIYTVTVLSTI